MIAGAIITLILHLIAVFAGHANYIFNSSRVDYGILFLLTGLFQFQELRYQRIIRYLQMNSEDQNK
jgi:hypothetical protein